MATESNIITQVNEQYEVNQSDLASKLMQAKYNPALICATAIDMVEKATDGEISFVDPSNPTVFLMEFAATLGANCISNTDSRMRELYPKLAVNQDELYHHMHSRQYVGRFATPSTATIQLVLSRKEILALAVETGDRDVKKMIIPRGTVFTTDNITFTLMYAIEIRVLPHDALQIVYITEGGSDPIQALETNLVDWDIISLVDDPESSHQQDLVKIVIQAKQVEIEYHLGDMLTSIDGFLKQFTYRDKYVHCRVYDVYGTERKELETTHSNFVFNASKPTAKLRVLDDNKLEVAIPHIYFTTNQIKGKVEVEIYTTKGNINIDLKAMADNGLSKIDFSEGVKKYVSNEDTKYTAPLSELSYFSCHAISRTVGGRDPIAFDELREKVIDNIYTMETPITRNQLAGNAKLKGYDLVTTVDMVPDRIFHVTKNLPAPTTGNFTSGASCAIDAVYVKLSELGTSSAIIDNGLRVTITPKALFRTVDGITRLVSDVEIPTESNLGVDTYIQRINSLEYSYTPFYYCLDANDGKFESRPYHMNNPSVINQRFIGNNPTTKLIVSPSGVEIHVNEDGTGYIVLVKVRGGANFQEIDINDQFAQLAYVPQGENDLAYINGTYLGTLSTKEIAWRFDIKTRYDFTSSDGLILSNFKMFVNEPRNTECLLSDEFQLFLGVYDVVAEGYTPCDIDELLGKFLLNPRREALAISQTSLKLKFGEALTNFWRNARTVSSEQLYERYEEDIVATFPETVYELDENGLIKFVGEGNERQPVVKHREGEVITDELGANIIRYRKGDVKLNSDGMPIASNPREVARYLDIFLVDGVYKFATFVDDATYAASIPDSIAELLTLDVKPMQQQLLEKTQLYYSPKRTMGTSKIIVEGGIKMTIINRFPVYVKYYMTEAGYNNTELREALAKMTSEVVNEVLKEETVSQDKIMRRLFSRVTTDDVMSIIVSGLGPDQNIQTYTATDDSSRCSLKRKVRKRADGALEVVEDLTVDFVNHQSIYND